MSDNAIPISDYGPVPEVFWSFETGMPFSKCTMCERDLLAEAQDYVIEKAIKKNGEVVFEHAICLDCREVFIKQISRQSMKLIMNYFDEHVNMEKRVASLKESCGTNVEGWLENCLVKNRPVSESEEYQIYAQCVGGDMLYYNLPYALSGECIDDIIHLLSDETAGAIGDYMDRHFGIDFPKSLTIL